MSVQVKNGALSWDNNVVQISNLTSIRKTKKVFEENIPPPNSPYFISWIGRVILIIGSFYSFSFLWKKIAWYLHLFSVGSLLLLIWCFFKQVQENYRAVKTKRHYRYIVIIEKNSRKSEYFVSDNEQFINELYENLSDVMHFGSAHTINYYSNEVTHYDNIENSIIGHKSYVEIKE